jgi:cyclophilin family peptidyl-prolyl cis-trans isomerase
MVTLRSLPEFDGKNVVFGEVLSGLDALDAMEAVDTEYPDWPKTQIMVVACGDRRS